MASNTVSQDLGPYRASTFLGRSGQISALKHQAPALALLVTLSGPVSSQAMTLEEMQTELLAMQAKMQEMQAMQVKMQEMQKELDTLRARDAERQATLDNLIGGGGDTGDTPKAVAANSPDSGGEHESDLYVSPEVAYEETQEVLHQDMPLAGYGRNVQLINPDFDKSTPLFGSDFRFSIGGYAKTDLIFDFDGVGDKYQFTLGDIPVNNSPQTGSYSELQIRESRTHLEIRNTGSPYKIDKFYLEFDFFDGKDNTNFRLRHAYMQFGQLLAGRTWSIITELRALPLILDFAAGDAILGGRSEQIKWDGDKIFGVFDWAIGLESYDDTRIVTPDTLDGGGLARSTAPRLSGGVSYPWDHGVLSVGAAVNEVRWDGTNGVANEEKLGWTTVIGSRVYLDPGNRNFVGFNAGYTHGTVADIIAFANAGTPNAALEEDGDLDLATGWNANMGFHFELPGPFSTNLHYAYTKLDHIPDLFEPDEMAEAWAAHANLIYDFDPQLRLGVEYMWGERKIVSGDDGDASRLQFSTIYYY